jgi:adenosylhomocysteine nucleosidase
MEKKKGTSGGHDPALNVFDIMLGKRSVNAGALKTGELAEGEGIEPAERKPMDLMASEGSAGEEPDAENIRYYEGDISAAYEVPFLGIRILSNNKTNGGAYNPDTAAANQEYVYEVVKQYISEIEGS